MSSDVWIGTAVSIPVSIAVGLALPHIQRWLTKRGESSHAKKLEQVQNDYNHVLYCALHTDLLLGQLLIRAISLIGATLMLVVLQGVTRPFGDLAADLAKSWHLQLYVRNARVVGVLALSFTLAVVISYLVWLFREVSASIKLYLNVRYSTSYFESVPEAIRDKELEEIIGCAKFDRAVPGAGKLRDLAKRSSEKSIGIVPLGNPEAAPPEA